jgi:hypothetical protein
MSGRGLLGTLIFLVAGSVLADDESLRSIRLAGESDRMARRLFEIDALLAAKQWPEAIQELQRIINENGDDLVPTGTIKDGVLRLDHRHARQARWLCHERLAALPAEALELYRRRVDPQARQWLDDGRANRDPLVLQKLLDEAFCSSVAAEALDLLGDLAFERGTLGEAERRWRLLEKAAASPRVDIAQVRAKRLLVRLF